MCIRDRLRSFREHEETIDVLAATDPANAWGNLLPWPARDEGAPRPRRTAQALVVLSNGRPCLYVERHALILFPAAAQSQDTLHRATAALLAHAPLKSLRILKVDGMDALASPSADRLVKAGFVRDYRGLVLSQG